MELIVSICGILGVLLVGVISPGPSFLLVAQTSVSTSRSNGVAAALGMGAGAAMLAALALLGLHAVLSSVPRLYLVLKICGGIYLIFLAVRIWKSAAKPLTLLDAGQHQRRTRWRSFYLALGTMLGNPKAAVQYGVIFAALLPKEVPASLSVALVPLVFLLEAGWYAAVAVVLSSASPRSTYLKFKTSIDRLASGVMGLLGLRLIAASKDNI